MAANTAPRFSAAYIRVSTDDQLELSPDSQLEEIRKYAEHEGIVILSDQIYIDAGISGKKAEARPEFMRMIASAKEKDCPFTCILVWKFSRFARNQEESIFYKSVLRSKCRIDVVSITEPLIAGPFGSLIERIIEWMDEFYSIRLAQEVKRSMTVNAERGKLQATPSFGYRFEDGNLVPDETEAAYVRRIFSDFVSGKGLFPLARELNDLGVRTHRGNRFENRTVEYILRNPVYIGKLRWNPSGKTYRDFSNENLIIADAEHEPLVSAELWDAAQQRLDAVKKQWGYKSRPAQNLKTWLSGLVHCSACGATLVFTNLNFYKCNNYAKGSCRSSQFVRVDILEKAVLDRLEADVTNAYVSCHIVRTGVHSGNDIARLESSLKQFRVKYNRLQDAYLSGVISLYDFSTAKKMLDDLSARTSADLEELRSRDEIKITQDMLHDAIRAALDTLRSPDSTTEDKSNAARSIIESCTYDKQSSTLSIVYRLIF